MKPQAYIGLPQTPKTEPLGTIVNSYYVLSQKALSKVFCWVI